MLKKKLILILSLVLFFGVAGLFTVFSLKDEAPIKSVASEVVLDDGFEDWSDETHSKDVEPDYDTVFPQEEVNRLDIVVSEENWATMIANMDSLYSDSDGRGGGMPEDTDENPVFVESQVIFDGTQWYNVGIRFKGNSSLRSAYQSGVMKLPFKLDFDEFEDDYEELENQRFYGFKEISLSSNYEDPSLLHEKIATEAFDSVGIATPETAFYELYINYGKGSTYFGLYTAVEVVDDTVLENNFNEDDGNLYKAIGDATSFASSKVGNLEEDFEKKNNEEENDWNDIKTLASVINSDTRESDYDVWKNNLEEIFDTSAFLKWLAVNTVIQNWDTYGNMTHNYYLYNNSDTGLLTWIPWDNNESFSDGKRPALSLTFNEVGEDWPLIRYLMDDEDYREIYLDYVDDFLKNTLDTDEFKKRVEFLHNLVEPYAIGENDGYTFFKSDGEFEDSLDILLDYIKERVSVAEAISLESDWEYDASAASATQGPGMGGSIGGPPAGGMRPPR